MIILTELGKDGKPVMDHGTPVSLSTINDTEEGMTFLKSRMAAFSHENPHTTYAIVRPEYRILFRTGEPQHPCAG
jgi:hypothetical protein